MEMAAVVAFASPGAQQKVSLFHNLQLKFSKRRPSSFEPEQREKSVHMLKRCSTCKKGVSIDQYTLQRVLTFLVSIRCIVLASTVKTGVSKESMTA
jgi:hypothetical protein